MDGMHRLDGRGLGLLFGVMLLAAAFCAACGSDREPAAVREPPAKAVAEAPPAKAVVKTPQVEPQPAAIPKEKVASYRLLLRDGRRKVQAKEYDAGVAFYEQALALRPGDPKLLVELGWAAFLKGDLDRATQATQQGLKGVRDINIKGSTLYNLGRIAEQRGDKDEAARRYRESLAGRPNAIVEKRLASLGVDTTAAPAPADEDSEIGLLEGPLPSVQAVCDVLVTANKGDGGNVGCAKEEAQRLEIDEGALRRALLLPVWRSYNGNDLETASEIMYYLVIETDRGAYHTRTWVSYVYNPGAFGIFEDLQSELSIQDLIPGSPQEIIMKAKHRRADTDLGILEEESEETEWLLVCGVVDGAPRCRAKIPTRYLYERTVMPMEGIEQSDPVEHTPGLPIRRSYSYRVEFNGKGGYTLAEIEPPVGDAATRNSVHAGVFSF